MPYTTTPPHISQTLCFMPYTTTLPHISQTPCFMPYTPPHISQTPCFMPSTPPYISQTPCFMPSTPPHFGGALHSDRNCSAASFCWEDSMETSDRRKSPMSACFCVCDFEVVVSVCMYVWFVCGVCMCVWFVCGVCVWCVCVCVCMCMWFVCGVCVHKNMYSCVHIHR